MKMRKFVSAAILVVLVFVLQSTCVATPYNSERLFPVKRVTLTGFIDAKGVVVIPLQFKEVLEYTEGLAVVKDVKTGKWGYVDRTGNYVIPPQYPRAFPFSEGLAKVLFEDGSEGHIDRTGRLIIKGSTGILHKGIVTIRMKDKCVFADRNGKPLFTAPPNSWLVGSGLVAFVLQNGRMGFMDRKGKVVIQPLYHCDGNWRDQQFEEKITPVSFFGEDGKEQFGFINKTGKVVIDFQYDWAEQFFDGLAMVSKNGKYGYVNTDGKVAIPLQYEGADHFSEGLAAVEVKGKWGFIDTKGRVAVQPQYLSRMWGSPMIFSEGMAAVRTATGTGVINRAGETIISPIYRTIEDFSGGLVLVRGKGGAELYFNKQGKVVWPRE